MPRGGCVAVTMLDTRGERCPLPVLRTEKALDGLSMGAQLVVLATDPVARLDIALYCRRNGHSCAVQEADDGLTFTIVKGASAEPVEV